MNEMDYGLKEMKEMDYGLKELRWNVINEVDNVTREELRLSDYVMCCKPITEQQTNVCQNQHTEHKSKVQNMSQRQQRKYQNRITWNYSTISIVDPNIYPITIG